MTQQEIKEKILKGGQLAIQRLLERKRRDGGYVAFSNKGSVIKVKAHDLKA